MAVIRTVEFDDFTPHELATVFAGMDDRQQAEFFASVWNIAKEWPGAGWCQQSCAIVSHLDRDGRNAVETLAANLSLEVSA